jgi:exonuclease III
MESIRIASFNCRAIKSSWHEVKDLCTGHDVVLLQEHWLLPYELGMLNNLHEDFVGRGWSAVDVSKKLVGRPYGGLAVLWRSVLINKCEFEYVDDRILICSFVIGTKRLTCINVYMPCDDGSVESMDNFLYELSKVFTVASDSELCTRGMVMILGDFNASANNRFLDVLRNMCKDYDMLLADMECLPGESYTFQNGRGDTTWIDHVLCPIGDVMNVKSIKVRYDFVSSDHFPISCEVAIQNLNGRNEVKGKTDVKVENAKYYLWDQATEGDIDRYHRELDRHLSNVAFPNCNCDIGCSCEGEQDNKCFDVINEYCCAVLESFCKACEATIPTKGFNKGTVDMQVAGWNECVKELHSKARSAYVAWRVCGKPRLGMEYAEMNRTRMLFKNAFRKCRNAQERIKADKLAQSLLNMKAQDFWAQVRGRRVMAKGQGCISGIGDAAKVAEMWREKYSAVYNRELDVRDVMEEVLNEVSNVNVLDFEISTGMIQNVVKGLCNGKAVGEDGLSGEAFKYATDQGIRHVTCLFNLFLRHGYTPKKLLRVRLCPIIKDKGGDVTDAENYRCVAVSNCIIKIFEMCVLLHMKEIVPVSNMQFGFRENHSTDICTGILKDTIEYYKRRRSYVFLCFLDIKKAFDSVNYWKLFKMLLKRGVSKSVVSLLVKWYKDETMFVRWMGIDSELFGRTNGVRQGSPLSPFLFNVYLNSVLESVQNADYGCKYKGEKVHILAYADDMVLLCPSWEGLQYVIHLAGKELKLLDLEVNVKKTMCMVVTPLRAADCFLQDIPQFELNGHRLVFCDKFRHLGHVVNERHNDDDDVQREIRGLYCRANYLIRVFGRCSVQVKRVVWRTFVNCLYGVGLWRICQTRKAQFSALYNGCVKRFFGYDKYASCTDMYLNIRLHTPSTLLHNAVVSYIESVRRCAKVNGLVANIYGGTIVRVGKV